MCPYTMQKCYKRGPHAINPADLPNLFFSRMRLWFRRRSFLHTQDRQIFLLASHIKLRFKNNQFSGIMVRGVKRAQAKGC